MQQRPTGKPAQLWNQHIWTDLHEKKHEVDYGSFFAKRQSTKIWEPFTESQILLKNWQRTRQWIHHFKAWVYGSALNLQHQETLLELENGVINGLSQHCRASGEEDSYQIWNLTTLLSFIPVLWLDGMRVKQHSPLELARSKTTHYSTDRHRCAWGPFANSNFRPGTAEDKDGTNEEYQLLMFLAISKQMKTSATKT